MTSYGLFSIFPHKIMFWVPLSITLHFKAGPKAIHMFLGGNIEKFPRHHFVDFEDLNRS